MTHIAAENLVVEYPVYGHGASSLRKQIVSLTTGGRVNTDNKIVTIRALDGVSFEIEKGERVGLL
ncbi:MAG: sugar ABC transporter ATP-binding protein, partial [Pseudomonadota bacterium]